MKTTGDLLRQSLNLAFFLHPDILVIEAGQDMLGMQSVQLRRFLDDIGQQICHLVADVHPSRRQKVHLDHGVSIVVQSIAGHEPSTFLRRRRPSSGEAISRDPKALGRMTRVRLPVGDVTTRSSVSWRPICPMKRHLQACAIAPHDARPTHPADVVSTVGSDMEIHSSFPRRRIGIWNRFSHISSLERRDDDGTCRRYTLLPDRNSSCTMSALPYPF